MSHAGISSDKDENFLNLMKRLFSINASTELLALNELLVGNGKAAYLLGQDGTKEEWTERKILQNTRTANLTE